MKEKRGRDKFNNFKSVLVFSAQLLSYLPLKVKYILFNLFRNTKGIFGIGVRYILVKSMSKKCGDNVIIHPGSYFFKIENLSIGNNVSIHPMCYIDSTGEIVIGNDVSIAHGTTILSSTHIFKDINQAIKDQGVSFGKTIIKDNVWIGAKVTILYNITINTGSVVGANSLVTKNIEEKSIVGGVPAKLIKKRG
ncbi:acyltransferase [Aerococcus urinaeequi]|uniref:acyltransferase n=1 Tax=Aerococcus urinaeequi TaxID=51665 RepID=UPI003B3B2B63